MSFRLVRLSKPRTRLYAPASTAAVAPASCNKYRTSALTRTLCGVKETRMGQNDVDPLQRSKIWEGGKAARFVGIETWGLALPTWRRVIERAENGRKRTWGADDKKLRLMLSERRERNKS